MQEQVITFLDKHKIHYELVEHPAVFTVAESVDVIDGHVPIKNLLLEDIKTHLVYLVVMRGLVRLDLKTLAAQLGVKKFQFIRPHAVESIVGVQPGSVSIFGLLHDTAANVVAVFDAALLQEPLLGFHPNVNTATLLIDSQAIPAIFEAMHRDYQVVDLGE